VAAAPQRRRWSHRRQAGRRRPASVQRTDALATVSCGREGRDSQWLRIPPAGERPGWLRRPGCRAGVPVVVVVMRHRVWANELPAWRSAPMAGLLLPRAARAGTTGPGSTLRECRHHRGDDHPSDVKMAASSAYRSGRHNPGRQAVARGQRGRATVKASDVRLLSVGSPGGQVLCQSADKTSVSSGGVQTATVRPPRCQRGQARCHPSKGTEHPPQRAHQNPV